MKNSEIKLLILLLLFAIAALILAYVAQYVFDLQPCLLCIYQRLPLLGIVAAGIVGLFLGKKSRKLALILCVALILCDVALASYQVAIEKKLIVDSSSCALSDNIAAQTIEQMQLEILSAKISRCDRPEFFFLGFSFAQWALSSYLALLAVVFGIIKISNNKAGNANNEEKIKK